MMWCTYARKVKTLGWGLTSKQGRFSGCYNQHSHLVPKASSSVQTETRDWEALEILAYRLFLVLKLLLTYKEFLCFYCFFGLSRMMKLLAENWHSGKLADAGFIMLVFFCLTQLWVVDELHVMFRIMLCWMALFTACYISVSLIICPILLLPKLGWVWPSWVNISKQKDQF